MIIKKNNHYLNLYAGTQKENIQDCIKNNHRVGNSHILILFDKEKIKLLNFTLQRIFIITVNTIVPMVLWIEHLKQIGLPKDIVL